jgi:nicotinamidase-related amidase
VRYRTPSTESLSPLFADPYGIDPQIQTRKSSGSGDSGPARAELLEDSPPLDRTTVNSWEDTEFVQTVRATGRRKLIFCALWTEVCMAFAALDALREGYEVYPVVDAIGGTSLEAHRAGLGRVVQAGAQPVSRVLPVFRRCSGAPG